MSAVLFVNDSKEETTFLTRGLPVKVIQTGHLDGANEEMKTQALRGIFVDIASARPSDIVKFKACSKQPNVPVFVLAHASEISLAIEYIKQGAQGFLLKGLSDSDSVLKLMDYATSKP